MNRRSHLVGTVPGPDARAAMQLSLAELGATLDMLPDGETGDRQDWIKPLIDGLRAHPDLELVRDGGWTDYEDVPRFKVRRGRKLSAESLDFGIAEAFRASYPTYKELENAAGGDIPFQVGIPGDFDLALFVLGPSGAFRRRRPFTDAMLREIRAIHAEAGSDVVFQIEVPAELVLVASAPGALQPLVARLMAGVITKLVRQAPEGARFGMHLCLGDMNHVALGRMSDTRPLVHLANAIAKAWPAGRPLEFIHVPLAAAIEPPPTDPAWYLPLGGLRLSDSTRLIAGFAHEAQDISTQRELRAVIERAVGGPVDVATTCGLGRRSPEAAVAAMRRTAVLASDD